MSGLYDLHTHTILSDGEMLPIELIRRMAVLGYTTVAITDHVDPSNTTSVIESLIQVRESAQLFGIRLLCGVEITHVPPSQIADLAKKAKTAGADIVVVHGETPVEPVQPARTGQPAEAGLSMFLHTRDSSPLKMHFLLQRTMLRSRLLHGEVTTGRMAMWFRLHAKQPARSLWIRMRMRLMTCLMSARNILLQKGPDSLMLSANRLYL